jgi:hypothetical protein
MSPFLSTIFFVYVQVCSKLHLSGVKLPEDLLLEMSQFSWKLLEMVPPLMCETICDAPFCKEWHAKEMEPEWNKELVEYELVYYRPILFFSYEGKVAQKAWVGNTAGDSKHNTDVADGGHIKCNTVYKKPRFKVQTRSVTNECTPASVPVMKQHGLEEKKQESISDEAVSEEGTEKSYFFGLKTF